MEVPALSSGKVSINKNILCQGDSVALYSKNVIGEAVWQFSKDLQNWQDLGFEDTLIDHPQSKGHYRLSVCNTVYSDTLAVDLDKKDVGLHALTFSNPCYYSLGVKVVNYGCYALDFTQNPLYLNVQMESGGQILQQQQKILNDNQQNPNNQPLAADSSMMVYFTNINYSNKQGNYKISVNSSMAADLYFKNNVVDSSFVPTFSVGLVSANKNAICAGDSVILFSAYASKSAVWQFSANQKDWQDIGTTDTLIDYPKSSGFYRLSVCDIYSDTLYVEVKPLPPSIKNYAFEFCKPEKQTINLDSNANISTINWYAKRDSDSAFYSGFSYTTTIDQSVTYFLESIKEGCRSDERGKLEITLGGCALKIPNVFTPNGDGINDIFEYRNTFGKSINTKIYDRWGKQVVSYKGNEGWDGKGVAAGTYYYVIKADEEVYSGSVVLTK